MKYQNHIDRKVDTVHKDLLHIEKEEQELKRKEKELEFKEK